MQNVQERPPFLSKSFLGFLAFNVITYSLLIAELVITNTQIHTEEDKVYDSFTFLYLLIARLTYLTRRFS